MQGLDRYAALRNLAAAMGKGSLPKATQDVIVEKSLPWSDPMFQTALDSIANDPNRKQYFPTWAEIRERLPSLAGGGDRGPNPFHWAHDGTWGGDPMWIRQSYLLMVLGTMFGFAMGLPAVLHDPRKMELRDIAVLRRRIPQEAIDAAAKCWKANEILDEEWLLEMLEGKVPCEWPRPKTEALL